MSMLNVPKPPLIPNNVNNDNNTTRLMKTSLIETQSITDGIATISNGYISNLNNPVNDNEIATKFFVDNSTSSSVGGPNKSIQINDGLPSAGFTGYPNLTYDNNTLQLDTLTNGTIVVNSGRIGGLNDPVNPQQAATKNYVDTNTGGILTVINIQSDPNSSYTYTPAQMVNTIINQTFYPNVIGIGLDTFPSAVDVKNFLGDKFQLGYSWTTIILKQRNLDQIYCKNLGGSIDYKILPSSDICGFIISATLSFNYCSVVYNSIITNITPGNEEINAIVTAVNFDNTQFFQITNQGLLTPNISSLVNSSAIIYPIPVNPNIISNSSVIYTYQLLAKKLIIRSGLTSNTSDILDDSTNIVTSDTFLMGGGTFTFYIQNISTFNLTLTLGAGWTSQSGNTLTIPSSNCGSFSVSVIVSPPSCKIRNLGIFPING